MGLRNAYYQITTNASGNGTVAVTDLHGTIRQLTVNRKKTSGIAVIKLQLFDHNNEIIYNHAGIGTSTVFNVRPLMIGQNNLTASAAASGTVFVDCIVDGTATVGINTTGTKTVDCVLYIDDGN